MVDIGISGNSKMMKSVIKEKITDILGDSFVETDVKGKTVLTYEEEEKCKISFLISNTRLSLLFNDSGPIVDDSNLMTSEDIVELLSEIKVILSCPIEVTNYIVAGKIIRTKFQYTGDEDDEKIPFEYISGRFGFINFLRKKVVKKIFYHPWLN